ncbi:MAG: hypothetical protein U0T77_13030 [Chitinophagales bacterium]
MIEYIKNKIKAFVIRRATANKLIDIVEVRTKEIGLTSVKTETDIRIRNTFFLSITILSIKTDLLNRDGLKVGRMSYATPQKIKGNSDEVLTTSSEISIITSLFQAISTLLSQHIKMKSVGVAQVKFLWWVFDIPVNDTFEIHPSKLKITQPETEEERAERLKKEAEWKAQYELEYEKRKTEREQKRAEWKEDILKRRYKENYIPKEQRLTIDNGQVTIQDVPLVITNEEGESIDNLAIEVELDANLITDIADERKAQIMEEDRDAETN